MPSVLITGAGRGFGRQLLEVYLDRGWSVFPLIRDISQINNLRHEYAANCFPIIGDVGEDSIMVDISDVIESKRANLDLLINNAGNIRKNRGIGQASIQDLIDHFNIHCAGALRCAKAVLPFMKNPDNPVIVNISSRWGSISRTACGQGGLIYAYQIAKAAQNMLSACLYQELKNQNIKVFAIHPGRLKTDVGAFDADTDPRQAALKLADWIASIDNSPGELKCLDLMSGSVIEW